jgi:hypothetical protein
MAKKIEAKKVTVCVKRPFMAAGNVVPATQGEGKDVKKVCLELPVAFARELIANGKVELTDVKKNYDLPKAEKTLEDDLADL